MPRIVIALALIALIAVGYFLFSEDTQNKPPKDAEKATAKATEGPGEAALKPEETEQKPPPLVRSGEEQTAEQARIRALEALNFPVTALNPGDLQITGRALQALGHGDSEEAQPLGQARYALFRINSDGSRETEPAFSGAVRQDGRFLVTLPAAWSAVVRLEAEGHLAAEASLQKSETERRLVDLGDIALEKTVSIEAEVVTGVVTLMEKETPVAGLTLSVQDAAGQVFSTGKTDSAGRLRIEGLPRRALTFAGRLEPMMSFTEERRVEAEGQVLRFVVQPSGRLKVRASSESGQSLKHFRLAMDIQRNNFGWMDPYFAEAELDGEEVWFTLEGVKVGAYDLYVASPGYALGLTQPVAIAAGETTEVAVLLQPGGRVRGQVMDKTTGLPVANAIVSSDLDLVPGSVDPNISRILTPLARATYTDERGRFELEDLSQGSHRIAAQHPDYARTNRTKAEVVLGGTPEDVKIELGLGATVKGHVYGRDGRPMEGALVLAIPPMDPTIKKRIPNMVRTKADGSYELKHLQPGFTVIVRVLEKPVAGEANDETRQATLRDGETKTITFGERGKGASVSGLVTWSDGSPAEDLLVMLMDTRESDTIPQFFQGGTTPEGRYEISGVPEGRYAVMIAPVGKGSDFAGHGTLVVPSTDTIVHDIRLDGGSLSGEVRSSQGGTVPEGAEVMILNAENRSFVGRLTTASDGTFQLPFVQPGRYLLFASATGFGPAQSASPIAVTSGQNTVAPPLILTPGGSIVGRVIDEQGQGVQGARLSLIDEATGQSREAWSFLSDAEGRFTIAAVPVGTYTVRAEKEGQVWLQTGVAVTGGSAGEATLAPPR